jgi:hypothetical protein
MRYQHAVEKLRVLAEGCESVKGWPSEDPLLREAYVFGEVLDGADPLESVEVVLVVNLPAEQVTWSSSPRGTLWLADKLRLSKGGFSYSWRSHQEPVWNHHVLGPVRFWSHEGTNERVLQALAERRFADIPRGVPPEHVRRERVAADLQAALGHLRDVHDAYWERDWRREHRGYGRYPENDLWEAVDNYLDLRDAAQPPANQDG